jgi:serine/threonine-protein kinase RIO1
MQNAESLLDRHQHRPLERDLRELSAFAARHGISPEEARDVVRRAGDRLNADALAERQPK